MIKIPLTNKENRHVEAIHYRMFEHILFYLAVSTILNDPTGK